MFFVFWGRSKRPRISTRRVVTFVHPTGGPVAAVPKEGEPVLRIMVLSDGDDTKSSTTAHA